MEPVVDFVKVTAEPLNLQATVDLVRDNSAGAVSTFIGTTRNVFEDKSVVQLDYEAYVPMAEKVLLSVIQTARSNWNLVKCAVHHRVGTVPVGEASVVVAVSSIHRRESFRAIEYVVDQLKEKAPIWKKEVYSDGSVWKENQEAKKIS